MTLFAYSYLWEMKSCRFSWLCIFLLSVYETVATAFHYPKQVKIAVLAAEVSDSVAACPAPLFM